MKNNILARYTLLILIPLLGACVPSLTAADNPIPFKTGQNWRLNSQSTLDAKIPQSTAFPITSASQLPNGLWTINSNSLDKDGTVVIYNNVTKYALVFDVHPVRVGASHYRICLLDFLNNHKIYPGYAAYITPIEATRSDYMMLLNNVFTNYSDRSDALKSAVKSYNDADNGPCTLELVK